MLEVVSLALLATSEAVSLAFEAVSAVVEAVRRLCRRKRNRDWRTTAWADDLGGMVGAQLRLRKRTAENKRVLRDAVNQSPEDKR